MIIIAAAFTAMSEHLKRRFDFRGENCELMADFRELKKSTERCHAAILGLQASTVRLGNHMRAVGL